MTRHDLSTCAQKFSPVIGTSLQGQIVFNFWKYLNLFIEYLDN